MFNAIIEFIIKMIGEFISEMVKGIIESIPELIREIEKGIKTSIKEQIKQGNLIVIGILGLFIVGLGFLFKWIIVDIIPNDFILGINMIISVLLLIFLLYKAIVRIIASFFVSFGGVTLGLATPILGDEILLGLGGFILTCIIFTLCLSDEEANTIIPATLIFIMSVGISIYHLFIL